MIKQFAKEDNIYLSPNFVSYDFRCRCSFPECVTTYIDDDLVTALEELIETAEEFVINSGYRCAKWNEQIGGEKNSFHLSGMAADIQSLTKLTGAQMARLAADVDAFNAGGIGTATNWIHVDVRKGGSARWTYPILHS